MKAGLIGALSIKSTEEMNRNYVNDTVKIDVL